MMRTLFVATAFALVPACATVPEEQLHAQQAQARRLLEAYESARGEALEASREVQRLRLQIEALRSERQRDEAQIAELTRRLDALNARLKRYEPPPSL